MYKLMIRANRGFQPAFGHPFVIGILTIFTCTVTALPAYLYFYHFAKGHFKPIPGNRQQPEDFKKDRGGSINPGKVWPAFTIGIAYPNADHIFGGYAYCPAIAEAETCPGFPRHALARAKLLP